ncbi:MAG TPA: hypothetical protein VH476_09680 [Solirubrobacterales bacterium]|jgi:hypothetical protein
MRTRLIRTALAAAFLALLIVASTQAEPESARVGDLVLTDNGGIIPRKLPRHEQVPISAVIDAHIGTVDGSHPPAIRSISIDFDKTLAVHAKGLPTCRKGQLEARPTAAAKSACRPAIVGEGDGEVEVAFPEQAPFSATGPIILFNGGVHGGTTLLYVHAYVSVPGPTAVVATVRLTRIHRGHFGIHADAEIPRIAGGAGSVTRFKVRIGRRFTYRGGRASYLTGSCPTGRYYTEGKVRFEDDTRLGLTHVLPCTPEG